MSHIIQKFGDWKKLNEDDKLGRIRERGDNSNKVVAIPVDKQTLKLKIVNDADVIDANDKLTVEGFDAILEWIKSQPKLIEYYPGLNKLDTNIVIYDVSKDTDRKQVIMFTIVSKISLQGSDQSVTGGINPQVRFVKRNELQLALKGALLNVKGGSNIVIDKSAPTFTLPYASAGILNATKAEVIQFIINAYKKIKKEPLAFNTPLMVKVKDEILAKKLGTASQLFVKSLNAGFGILDAQLGEDLEVDITKTLYDKLQAIPESKEVYLGLTATRIVETLSTVITGFDVDAFLAVAKTITPDTGDIIVPEGGFKEGMTANAELAKFQKILHKYFKKSLGKWSVYINFAAKTKGDGNAGAPVGNYGKTTTALVSTIKTYLENPRWENSNGAQIDATFIKRIQDEIKAGKITESRSTTYLGLNGKTIINEDFGAPVSDPAASDKPVYTPNAKSTSKPATSVTPAIPIKTEAEIKAFQNYVLTTKSDKEILGPSGADGQLGGKTYAAWAKYGADYQKKAKANNANPTQATKNKTQFDAILKLLKTNSTSAKAKVTTHSIKGKVQGRFITVRFTHGRFSKCSISFYEYQDGHSVNTFRIYNQKEGTVDETGAVDSVSGGNVSLRITKGTFKGATFSGPILEVLAKAVSSSKASWSYDQ